MQIRSSWPGEAFTKGAGPLTAVNERTFEGVFSDTEPDCAGDAFKGWAVLADALPLLWMHDPDRRIGTVYPRVEGKRLVGRGELYARGHSDETANAIYQISQPSGLGASIGGLKWHRPEGLHAIVSEVSLTPPGAACCRSAKVSVAADPIAKALRVMAGHRLDLGAAVGAPARGTYDPLADARAFCEAKREEMAAASRHHRNLAPSWSALLERYDGDEGAARERWRALKRFGTVVKAFG
jgi:hypothetical protein